MMQNNTSPQSKKTGASSPKDASWFGRFLGALKRIVAQIKNAIANLLGLSTTHRKSKQDDSIAPVPITQEPTVPEPEETLTNKKTDADQTQQVVQSQPPPPPILSNKTEVQQVVDTKNLENLLVKLSIRLFSFVDPMNQLRQYQTIYSKDRIKVEHSLSQIRQNKLFIEDVIKQHKNISPELQNRLEQTLQAIVDDKNMTSEEQISSEGKMASLKNLISKPSIVIDHMKHLNALTTSLKRELEIPEENVISMIPSAKEVIEQAKKLCPSNNAFSGSALSEFLTKEEKTRLRDQIESIEQLSSNTPEYEKHVSQLSSTELTPIFAMSEQLEASLRIFSKTLQTSALALLARADKSALTKKIENFERESTFLDACLTYDLFMTSGEQAPKNFKFYIMPAILDTLPALHSLKLAIPGDTLERLPDEETKKETLKETLREQARDCVEKHIKLLNFTGKTVELRMHLMVLDQLSEERAMFMGDSKYFAIKEQIEIVERISADLQKSHQTKEPATTLALPSKEEVWTRQKETARRIYTRERRAAEKAAAEIQSDLRVKWILNKTTEIEEGIQIYRSYSQHAPMNLRNAEVFVPHLEDIFKTVQEAAQAEGYNDPDVVSFIVSNAVISQLSDMHSKDQLEKFNQKLQALQVPPPLLVTSEEELIVLRAKIGIKIEPLANIPTSRPN